MSEQPEFEFEMPKPKELGTPIAVMRWKLGWLTVRWNLGVKGYFRSWDAALACVLHPLNDHVKVLVRR